MPFKNIFSNKKQRILPKQIQQTETMCFFTISYNHVYAYLIFITPITNKLNWQVKFLFNYYITNLKNVMSGHTNLYKKKKKTYNKRYDTLLDVCEFLIICCKNC